VRKKEECVHRLRINADFLNISRKIFNVCSQKSHEILKKELQIFDV